MRRGFSWGAPSPLVVIGGRKVSTFFFAGVIGALASGGAGLVLSAARSLSLGTSAVLWASALATVLAYAMLTKIFTGRETLVYYRHELVILAVAASILNAAGRPVLAYLDVVVLGIGVFLVFGRLGCFAAGCCHGSPAGWGVHYRHEHADAGFASQLVGVRLLPIQLVESAWVLVVVGVGVALFLANSAPGTVLVWYTLAYGAARFGFEIFRGDVDRPRFWGASEAQWLSVVLILAVLWATAMGRLPSPFPLLGVAGVAAGGVVGLVILGAWARCPVRRITAPDHVAELAHGVQVLTAMRGAEPDGLGSIVALFESSLGLKLSYGCFPEGVGVPKHHYALSSARLELSEKLAHRVASIIARLRHGSGPYELRSGGGGIVHIFVSDEAESAQTEVPHP